MNGDVEVTGSNTGVTGMVYPPEDRTPGTRCLRYAVPPILEGWRYTKPRHIVPPGGTPCLGSVHRGYTMPRLSVPPPSRVGGTPCQGFGTKLLFRFSSVPAQNQKVWNETQKRN